MAKQDYLVPVGMFKKTNNFIPGHFSLKKMIAFLLKQLNVPFQDGCCDPLENGAPVRYNPAQSRIEYYDKTTDAWVDVPTP